jgi:hypothetical protein
MKIPNGIIKIDSEYGKYIGFTSDKFEVCSYLWGFPSFNGIMISLIISKEKGKGYFKNLIKNLEQAGITFRIPTPSNEMIRIGKKQGWVLGSDGESIFLTNKIGE